MNGSRWKRNIILIKWFLLMRSLKRLKNCRLFRAWRRIKIQRVILKWRSNRICLLRKNQFDHPNKYFLKQPLSSQLLLNRFTMKNQFKWAHLFKNPQNPKSKRRKSRKKNQKSFFNLIISNQLKLKKQNQIYQKLLLELQEENQRIYPSLPLWRKNLEFSFLNKVRLLLIIIQTRSRIVNLTRAFIMQLIKTQKLFLKCAETNIWHL